MKIFNKRFSKKMAIIVAAGVILLPGGGTVFAAQSSKPGDTLYGVKRASESVRLALALTSGMKQSAQLSIAQNRLSEVQALLSDPTPDAQLINTTLSDFEAQNQDLAKTIATGATAAKILEIEEKYTSTKSQIDKQFASQQSAIENNRESLKQQYEEALKAGDSAKAQSLLAQINGIEAQLKGLETAREAAKQKIDTATSHIDSSVSEDVQKQVEAQKQAAEKAAEAAKQAAEQAAEAQKKAAEAAAEAAKQAAEQH